MRFNHHFSNHFGSCMLLARARDPHRNRDVELRMIPGEFDIVGVTDGTDAWVAPVAINPFSVDIKRILEYVRVHGHPPDIAPPALKRRATTPEPEPDAAPVRRRIILPPQPEQTRTRRAIVHP